MGNDASSAKGSSSSSNNNTLFSGKNNKITFIQDWRMSAFGAVKLLEVINHPRTIVAISCSQSSVDPMMRQAIKHRNFSGIIAYDSSQSILSSQHTYFFEYIDISLDEITAQRRLQNIRFPETDLWRIAKDVLNCLHYLQTHHNLAMYALSPSHLFLDNHDNCIKIFDTNLIYGDNHLFKQMQSANKQPHQSTASACNIYSTPEAMYASTYNDTNTLNQFKHQSDIFLLGLTLLELATFIDSTSLCDAIQKRINTPEIDNRLQSLHPLYSFRLQSLIRDMLTIDPRKRPLALDLLNSIETTSNYPNKVSPTIIPICPSIKPYLPHLPIAEKITARNITFADLSPSQSSSSRRATPTKSPPSVIVNPNQFESVVPISYNLINSQTMQQQQLQFQSKLLNNSPSAPHFHAPNTTIDSKIDSAFQSNRIRPKPNLSLHDISHDQEASYTNRSNTSKIGSPTAFISQTTPNSISKNTSFSFKPAISPTRIRPAHLSRQPIHLLNQPMISPSGRATPSSRIKREISSTCNVPISNGDQADVYDSPPQHSKYPLKGRNPSPPSRILNELKIHSETNILANNNRARTNNPPLFAALSPLNHNHHPLIFKPEAKLNSNLSTAQIQPCRTFTPPKGAPYFLPISSQQPACSSTLLPNFIRPQITLKTPQNENIFTNNKSCNNQMLDHNTSISQIQQKIHNPMLNQQQINSQITPTRRKPIPKITVISSNGGNDRNRSISPIITSRPEAQQPQQMVSFVQSPPSSFQFTHALTSPVSSSTFQPIQNTILHKTQGTQQQFYRSPSPPPLQFTSHPSNWTTENLHIQKAAQPPSNLINQGTSINAPSVIIEESDSSLMSISGFGPKSTKNNNSQFKLDFNAPRYDEQIQSDTSMLQGTSSMNQQPKQRYLLDSEQLLSDSDRPVIGSPTYNAQSAFNFDFSSNKAIGNAAAVDSDRINERGNEQDSSDQVKIDDIEPNQYNYDFTQMKSTNILE